MAFRSISSTQKLVLGVGGASAIGGLFTVWWYPRYTDQIKTYTRTRTATAEEVARVEDGFRRLQEAGDKCHSLLKTHLTQSVLDKLKYKKTVLGATLWDVIASGVENLDAGVGVYAPDKESYKTFAPLFDAIIQEYHGFSPSDTQPPVDLGGAKAKELKPLDADGKYIISTRIRCGRSLEGYPFNPLLTEDDYHVMQMKVSNALKEMPEDDLKGKYYPLQGMDKQTQKQLIADHFLFKEGDRHLQKANACRYWPVGRGIFHNNEKTFLVWVNEEDHMRIISMEKGGDVGRVLDRLNRAVKAIEKKVPFARDDRLGWLTFCPTNLGSTVRASVHIKLPKVSKREDFKKICDGMNLQIRGIHGEHSESEGGVYDISNKARLGLSEYEAVLQMYNGVAKLIQMENES